MRSFVVGLAAIIGLSVAPAQAQTGFSLGDDTAKPAPAATQCRGTDMLAELAVKEPDLHARIMRDAAAVLNDGAILWKVEKAGLATSHLFGTMHITDARVTQLSPAATAALSQSKAVVLEIGDMSDSSAAAALLDARELAFFMDGRNLSSMLPPEDFAKAQGAVAQAGVPPNFAGMLKPWIVSMLLASSPCERDSVQNGGVVLDAKIAKEAKARGIPVTGLETMKSQLKALASIPEDQQIGMLKTTLKYVDRSSDLLETTLQLYLTRKMGAAWPFQLALGEKAGVKPSAFSSFETDILIKRNLEMGKGSLLNLDKGGAFIAVGALHLSGKQGLVELFRKAGYTVTAVE